MRLCNSTPRAAATALHASVVIAYLDLHVLSCFFLFWPDGGQSSPFHTPFFFVSESSSTLYLSVICSISLGNRPNTTITACDRSNVRIFSDNRQVLAFMGGISSLFLHFWGIWYVLTQWGSLSHFIIYFMLLPLIVLRLWCLDVWWPYFFYRRFDFSFQ